MLTAKSEDPFLNMTNTAHRRDRWWLLDVETSGLDRERDSIIALRLARMEALPAPPRSWPDVPPENRHLAQLYRLTRAVFYQLEETR